MSGTITEKGVNVKANLFALKRQLELRTGQAYTWEEIAKGAGLNPNTVYSLANDKSQGIRFETMRSLMDFFQREGMEIEAGDLFLVSKQPA
jgi:DNA-binding Xre family transcriptional regulator